MYAQIEDHEVCGPVLSIIGLPVVADFFFLAMSFSTDAIRHRAISTLPLRVVEMGQARG
jgi:hypothetical protein